MQVTRLLDEANENGVNEGRRIPKVLMTRRNCWCPCDHASALFGLAKDRWGKCHRVKGKTSQKSTQDRQMQFGMPRKCSQKLTNKLLDSATPSAQHPDQWKRICNGNKHISYGRRLRSSSLEVRVGLKRCFTCQRYLAPFVRLGCILNNRLKTADNQSEADIYEVQSRVYGIIFHNASLKKFTSR